MDSLERLRGVFAERYAIQRVIGSGATATVYLAREVKHDRLVALKLLHPQLRAEVGAERFMREIEIAANLSHPHILPLFDSGEIDDFVYFTMPYVEGPTLRERLDAEPQLPIDESVSIATDVADALAHAHEHGILHRDIKPANILLMGEHAVVGDFGVGRAILAAGGSALTSSGIVIGTPLYMSPEQASGEARLDGRSDIYALGCVLYEMLAGEPPFTGGTAQAVIARHLAGTIPRVEVVRPHIPERLAGIVDRALAKSPADRYATAQEFASELRSWSRAAAEPPARTWWKPALGAAAVIVMMGLIFRGLGGGANTEPAPAPPLDPNRIAVLGFADRSVSQKHEVLTGALADELASALSAVEGLTVIAPQMASASPAEDVSYDSLGRALDAGTLVIGSLDEAAGRYRLTVQLTSTATGELISSPIRVGAPLSDPAAYDSLRIGVVETVARELRGELGEHVRLTRWRRESGAPEAWRLVELAKQQEDLARRLANRGNSLEAQDVLLQADSLYARSATLAPAWFEPRLLRGWNTLKLASSVASLRLRGERVPSPAAPTGPDEAQWCNAAMEYADAVLATAPLHPGALALRGAARAQLWRYRDGEQRDTLIALAEADLRRAVEISPYEARAWLHLSDILHELGRHGEAAEAVARAMRRDAYLTEDAAVVARQFYDLLEAHDLHAATAVCEDGRRRFVGDPNFANCRITLLGESGATPPDIAAAWRELRSVEADREASDLGLWGHRRAMVAMVLARNGIGDSALAVIGRARDSLPFLVSDTAYLRLLTDRLDVNAAYVHLLLGQPLDALRLLEGALESSPGDRPYVAQMSWFDPLHDNPRFQRLVAPDR